MSVPLRPATVVVVLDCDDSVALGDFYARLLGWEARPYRGQPRWIDVIPPAGEPAGFALACQQIDDYVRPTWPDGPVPAQSHLDLHVDSIEESTPLVEAAGATRHAHQPGEEGGIGDAGRFVVFVDPAGHLFCLCEP
jgi:predicted enzyme related to lactoylglutathione lyase